MAGEFFKRHDSHLESRISEIFRQTLISKVRNIVIKAYAGLSRLSQGLVLSRLQRMECAGVCFYVVNGVSVCSSTIMWKAQPRFMPLVSAHAQAAGSLLVVWTFHSGSIVSE